jgi:sec-independent protein translocase protein TatA
MEPDYSQSRGPNLLAARPSVGPALIRIGSGPEYTETPRAPHHGQTGHGKEGRTLVHFSSPAEIFGMDGLIILVVVALVLFGSTQIPKLARSLGSAKTEFKQGLAEGENAPTVVVAPVVPAPVAVAPVHVAAAETAGVRVASEADAR